jgi:hypothetical protein
MHACGFSLTDATVKILNGKRSFDVITPFFEILPRFQVDGLSGDNVWMAHEWNSLQQAVYHYDYDWPSYNYNCIYGDKPLQGWWP